MESGKIFADGLQDIILKLLENKGRMYGYEMTKAVRAAMEDKLNLSEAALYPILHKMEADELLETETEWTAGRWRKYYSLKEKGTAVKVKKSKAWMENVGYVFKNLKPKWSYG